MPISSSIIFVRLIVLYRKNNHLLLQYGKKNICIVEPSTFTAATLMKQSIFKLIFIIPHNCDIILIQ